MSKRKLEYQNFELTKVKQTKDGLEVEYTEKGGSYDQYTVKTDGQPHPDFENALLALQESFAKRLDLLKGWDRAIDYAIALKDQDAVKQAKADRQAEIERCKVSGISFSGHDQLYSVKLTGSLTCTVGSFGMATPNIVFASEKLGYEGEVKVLCEKVKEETFLYMFKNKKAQQDLMDQAEEAEEEEQELIIKGD